ncbi:MAG TPA: hypothetical protein VLJ41_02180, partial [Segetibacter sp.]|nr:hypothetical protein [Segetibacter sp.]
AITILKEMGYEVVEDKINIEQIIKAHKAGELREVFGTGTAATISPIKELRYEDYVMEFKVDEWTVSPELKKRLNDIRNCKVADRFGWMFKI